MSAAVFNTGAVPVITCLVHPATQGKASIASLEGERAGRSAGCAPQPAHVQGQRLHFAAWHHFSPQTQ